MNADKKNIIVVYPNGNVKVSKSFFIKPKVIEGSTIIVTEKLETEEFNITDFAKDLASLVASFSTMYLVWQGIGSGS